MPVRVEYANFTPNVQELSGGRPDMIEGFEVITAVPADPKNLHSLRSRGPHSCNPRPRRREIATSLPDFFTR